MVIHADKARPHTALRTRTFMAENSMKPAPHPPYSSDLAPSDFDLFGYVKGRWTGQMFESREDLFEAMIEILRSIPMEKVMEVFLEWERRLRRSIDIDGSVLNKDSFYSKSFVMSIRHHEMLKLDGTPCKLPFSFRARPILEISAIRCETKTVECHQFVFTNISMSCPQIYCRSVQQ
jgi:transposase